MRAQVSLELFFSVSLFVLILFWMNHFVTVASDTSFAAGTSALRSAVFSLQAQADAACLSQASIQIPAPCVSAFSAPLAINVSGRSLFVGFQSVPTRCAFEVGQAVAYACGSPLCFSPYANGTMRLLGGPCP